MKLVEGNCQFILVGANKDRVKIGSFLRIMNLNSKLRNFDKIFEKHVRQYINVCRGDSQKIDTCKFTIPSFRDDRNALWYKWYQARKFNSRKH